MRTGDGSWDDELDRLEAHADRAEATLSGLGAAELEPWAPAPAGDLGPMPDEFIDRARVLLERQQRLMSAMPGVIAGLRQQQRVTDKFGSGGSSGSVYLDHLA